MRKDVLYEVLRHQDDLLSREIAGFDKPCRFSGWYKRRKKLIIKAVAAEGGFERGYAEAEKTQRVKYAVSAILLALLALGLCGFGIYIISGGFHGEAADSEISPAEISSVNYPQIVEGTANYTEILLWYTFDKKEISPLNIFADYSSGEGRPVTLRQWENNGSGLPYDNKNDNIEEIIVNGHSGLLANRSSDEKNYCEIFWYNDENNFEIKGNFTKDELLDIANAVELWRENE